MSTITEFLAKSKFSLKSCIFELSNKIQKNYDQTTNGTIAGSNVILAIEDEAMEHIEYLVLNLFYLLLTNSTQQQTQQQQQSLLQNNQSGLSTSSISLTSLISTSSSTISASSTNTVLLNQHELNSLPEVETRIRRLLPKNLAETAIQRGNTILEKYQNLSKRQKDNLIRSTNTPSSSSSIFQAGLSSLQSLATLTTQKPLPQSDKDNSLLIYPVDKLNKLIKSLFQIKLDKNILIYLITILEFLTKDILRISCGYVRNLGKQIITKRDVCVAIRSDHSLVELFCRNNGSSSISNDTDDDLVFNNQLLNSLLNESVSESSLCGCLNLDKISFNSISSGDSDRTICNECQLNSNKRINLYSKIYTVKVKEFQFELNQHINDLNLLRKLFRNYLLKCINKFYSTEAKDDDNMIKKFTVLTDSIFGNLNDLYECSLRLLDLLDDLIQPIEEQTFKSNEPNSINIIKKTLLVGQAFWELAEGEDFDVYDKYAKVQIENNFNYDNINKLVQMLQSKSELYNYLNNKLTFNISDTYRYLLPKLLLSPIYYILYLYDTIDYLISLTQCEDDKSMLEETLDTLKRLKFYLNEKFLNSKLIQTFYSSTNGHLMRPIETSIRILQYNYTNFDTYLNLILTYPNLKELFKKLYIFKLNSQTEIKWAEIKKKSLNSELNTEVDNTSELSSFKQTLSKRLNPYLYENNIFICKTSQAIPQLSNKHSNLREYLTVLNNTKFKLNERFIYLFDGLLLIFKQIYNQSSSSLSSQNDIKLKLKHEISLAKCILVDRKDDDLCFELQVFFNSNQECEYFLFMCKSNIEKIHLMSLFCYIQYKLQLDRMLQNVIESLNHQNPLPIPPRDYRFNQPDSADNIIFDSNDVANLLLPASGQAISSDGPIIKAATIEKLIERLTHHLYLYPKFSRTFLMCFREFCTPIFFFDLLIERFNVPELKLESITEIGDNATDDESVVATKIEIIKRYKREYQQPIKLKVINVMRHWIDGYYNDDFESNEELLDKLNEFIEKLGDTNNRYQQVLIKSLEKKQQQSQDVLNNEVHHVDPGSLSLYPAFETHLEEMLPCDILTIHPLEFARQATLMELEIYKSIKPNELITLGWMKPNKHELAPNVTRLINLSNKFTYWYSKLIVETLNLDERCAVMQRILDIANYFSELNNFSGLREIYGALEAASAYRLQVTRDRINIENQPIYEKFRLLFDNHSNVYLEELKKCNPPCVPFIGTHLTIILKTYEYNKLNADKQKQQIQQLQLQQQSSSGGSSSSSTTTTPPPSPSLLSNSCSSSRLVNFAKYRLLVDFVTDLLQYQSTTYKLHPHKRIQSFIMEDIDNYYQKATSVNEIISSGEASSAISEELVKVDQAQMIASWLDAKSKLIEPEKNKFIEYPQLRKYNLKSPAPKYLKLKKQNYNVTQQSASASPSPSLQSSRQHHQRVHSSLLPQPKLVKQPLQHSKAASKNGLLTLDNISINTDLQSTSTPLSTPKLDKSSLSSADSSAPNSPPPNYDDVFQVTTNQQFSSSPSSYGSGINTLNCYDNKTYFKRLASAENLQKNCRSTSSHSSEAHSPSYRINQINPKKTSNQHSNTIFFPNEQMPEQQQQQQHRHNARLQMFPAYLQPPPAPPPPPPSIPNTDSIAHPPPLPARQRNFNLT